MYSWSLHHSKSFKMETKEPHNHVHLENNEKDKEMADELTVHHQRRIIRKIDWRVTVICGVLFFVSLMDRTNLGFAKIAGMSEELSLGVDNRYNLCALIFFIPYIIVQFPSTLIVRSIGARPLLAGICFAWGIVMIGMGFISNWIQLLGQLCWERLKLVSFPFVSIYSRLDEVQKRYALFFLISSCSSAFSGILAYGLIQMNGIAKLSGWRWIFIMEGILTSIIGMVGYLSLVDFPDQIDPSSGFLSADEIKWVLRRIDCDRGDAAAETFEFSKFLRAGADWKLWLLGVIFCCLTTVTYAISFFLPTILIQMGFDLAVAQCLTAPPFVLAGVMMLVCGWIGDKYHIRGPLVIFNCLVCLVGLLIVNYCHLSGIRYFGLFLVTAGVNANIPCAMAYQANNIHGHWSRAFGSATLVGFGGLGGVVGSLVFRNQDAPMYKFGFDACMIANGIIVAIVIILSSIFYIENRKIRSGKKILNGQEGLCYTL
ncbi:High-affinity nicotinic acid transporter [Talaromyces pinophilus]|nr:High-affinity nicotinic acid transporter [Talaromyces pinophilus]